MSESRVQVKVLMAPMRTAEEQWRVAGPETCLGTMNPGSGLVYVGGKGGDAALTVEEWQKYERLVNGWRAGTVQRFDDAPVISMREVDEDLQMQALTRRAPSHIASSFREIERLLQEYVRCLSDEEREEIIRQIGSTVLPLKEAVLRAEEIWIDGDCNERDELIKAEREIERLRGMLNHAECTNPVSALAEQRNALAEARLRIIARYEHVEKWLDQPAPVETLKIWAGIVGGLRQARQIIGNMWDELPVPKPQAVIDHEAHMSRVMKELNTEKGGAA